MRNNLLPHKITHNSSQQKKTLFYIISTNKHWIHIKKLSINGDAFVSIFSCLKVIFTLNIIGEYVFAFVTVYMLAKTQGITFKKKIINIENLI